MKYMIQPGIICRAIADEYFLIATGESLKLCPNIEQINNGAAFYWNLLEDGLNSEQMLDTASKEFSIDKEILRPGLDRFLKGLIEKKYIICKEDACS